MKDKFLTLTGRSNLELIHFDNYLLHPVVIAPLVALQKKAKKEIQADLKIVSSYRNFERQQVIWNGKLNGERKVLDDQDNIVLKEEYSREEFILKVLRFSALPGTSRHHWGTDFDIFDANNISQENLALTHSECIGDGPCAKLHSWLDHELISSPFFRPYNYDQDGVAIEKWHLSYTLLAQEYYKHYTIDIFLENLNKSSIAYKEIILKNPDFYFQKFVKNISQD